MNVLSKLPNINTLKDLEQLKQYRSKFENIYFTNVIRTSLDEYRKIIIEKELDNYNQDFLIDLIHANFKKSRYNLKRVINATGTIIHTNLGRSLYSKNVVEAINDLAPYYNNLEYNLDTMQRGSRYDHIRQIIKKLTGCEDVVVVNNNAAALLLTLTSLVTNSEVILSRGELIEIGGSFRVPEIMRFSNTKLHEVGTTNRTHTSDYINAINQDTKAILKIHTSNYKIMGFTSEVKVDEITQICHDNNLISIEDIGSGSLINFAKYTSINEPTIQNSIDAGVDIVTFSGDKLLGGMQAGFIIGKKKYIDIIKKNNLLRSLRVDKLSLVAIEATLQEYLDEANAIKNIPTLNMICEDISNVKQRADYFYSLLKEKDSYKIERTKCVIGGGSLPCVELDSYKLVITSEYNVNDLNKKLHQNYIPIITKTENNKIIFDLKTLTNEDIEIIAEFLNE